MYRQASLRLPCVVCGVEQPIARMALAPEGGHWCWKCQMGAQIVEHESHPKRDAAARGLRSPRRQLLATFVLAFAIALILAAVTFGGLYFVALEMAT